MGDRRVEAFVGRHRAQVLPGLEHAVVELVRLNRYGLNTSGNGQL